MYFSHTSLGAQSGLSPSSHWHSIRDTSMMLGKSVLKNYKTASDLDDIKVTMRTGKIVICAPTLTFFASNSSCKIKKGCVASSQLRKH